MTTSTSTHPERPVALPVDPGNLPQELRDLRQWVCWDWSWLAPEAGKPGRWTKTPLTPNGQRRASSVDAHTWSTFADALARADRDRLPGVGFVFTKDDPYLGVDLDKCHNPESGVLAQWASPIIREVASYAELSPSGTGVHVILKGRLPEGDGARRRTGAIEMYQDGRYFTMTGHRIPGAPATVEHRQPEIDRLYASTFTTASNGQHETPTPPRGSTMLTDDEVIEKAMGAQNGAKFRALWNGDTRGHGDDDSAADLALLSMIAFYTQDPAQLDRIFQRSGLMRAKWAQRSDYRERSIRRALDRSETWTPGREQPVPIINGTTRTPAERLATLPEADLFPLDVLPPVVRTYCASAARSLGTDVPVEMVAAPLLAIVGALVGKRLGIAAKGSWIESPGLFVAIVAKPGSAKTAAISLARKPMARLQSEAREDFEQQLATYRADHDAWTRDKSNDDRGPEPLRPRMRHYFSTDTTVERLGELLNENPGIAIISDELRGWLLGFDKYRSGGKGNDRQAFLSLWSSDTLKVDRKATASDPLYITSPVASIAGGLQTDFAADFKLQQGSDGLTERVLPVVLSHGSQRWTEESVSARQADDLYALFQQIDSLDPSEYGEQSITVQLHPDAYRHWVHFYNANCERVNAATGLEAGMHQKMSNHTLRFALILHALWHPSDPRVLVSEETMLAAITLAEWWRQHIRRYLTLVSANVPAHQDDSDTRRVLRVLEATTNLDRWVTRTEIYRGVGNMLPESLDAVLAGLLAAGRVERKTDNDGRKPRTSWRLVDSHFLYFSHFSHLSPASDAANTRNTTNTTNTNHPRNGTHHGDDPESVIWQAPPPTEPDIDDDPWPGEVDGIWPWASSGVSQ